MAPAPTRVVIIGGGMGGAAAAKKLEASYDVTLIDEKDYYEYVIASVRFFVDESFLQNGTWLHSQYLKRARVLIGRAHSVSDNEVELEDGRKVPFDFLIVSTGASFAGHPKTLAEKRAWYLEEKRKIENAQSILIAGGGPIGVEIAAEILTEYPNKNVTLVHSGERLLPFMNKKAARMAKDFLEKKGATVILYDKVALSQASAGSHVYRTTAGQTITADHGLLASRARFDSAFLARNFADALNGEGRVRVEPSLLVLGTRNIFAIGDVTALPEAKQGYYISSHVAVVAANLQTLSQNPDARKLKAYKAQTATAVALVSLGRKNGIMQTPLLTFSGSIPASLKSRNLFLDKCRKELGVVA